MRFQGLVRAILPLAAMGVMLGGARAWDEAKYPDFKGQWNRIGGPRWETRENRAPLTAEYKAIYEANVIDQAEGGQGTTPTYTCLSPGMPRVMNAYGEVEFVVTPDTTYVLIQHILDDRRIFTDGRDWPTNFEPSFLGYSIGKWIDTDGDGRYDVLEVETRGLRGPRAYDASGMPFHSDNLTVVRERIYIDKTNPNVAHDEVTVIDNALTRPWTTTRNYERDPNPRPNWEEVNCSENNNHVRIGDQDYMVSADGFLMPSKKGQKPPDLRYFNINSTAK
jgi:hypothetical protein